MPPDGSTRITLAAAQGPSGAAGSPSHAGRCVARGAPRSRLKRCSEVLWLDYETASELDITVAGLENYARHPSTRILMLAYAFNGNAVKVWEPEDGDLPAELRAGLTDPFVVKMAFNTSFERLVSKYKLDIDIPIEEWLDVMVLARYLSIPGDLEHVGKALKLDQEQAKIVGKDKAKVSRFWTDSSRLEGSALIQLFCVAAVSAHVSPIFGPQAAVFRTAREFPREWAKFREYCARDVEAERTVYERLIDFPLPPHELALWYLDQHINSRGIPVDMELVRGAIRVRHAYKEKMLDQIKTWTGVANPNADPQLLPWLRTNGYPFSSLAKGFVARALRSEAPDLTETGRQVLRARGQSAKTAGDKYEVLQGVAAPGEHGDCLRYFLSYLGSSRAGRWSSFGVQFHNLPRPAKAIEKKLELAVSLLRTGDMAAVEAEFADVMDVVAACVRGMFCAPPGWKFVVCDLNAIENRVLGWVANCPGILNVFAEGKCPYRAFGARMKKIDYEAFTKAYDAKESWAVQLRQDSKPAVLGCGYALAGGEELTTPDGDLIWTGLWGYAKGMGTEISKEFAHECVDVFRGGYLEVSGRPDSEERKRRKKAGIWWLPEDGLWYKLEQAAMCCVKTGQSQTVGVVTFELFTRKTSTLDVLRVKLPSGRCLHYLDPEIIDGDYGPQLSYGGQDQKTKQWTRIRTYGGKWTENIVQAIARDLLAHSMLLAEANGGHVVGHVHDEIICLACEDSTFTLEKLRMCMMATPWWAQAGVFSPIALPLGAEGYEAIRYKKG